MRETAYWLLGGTLGLDTVRGEIEEQARERRTLVLAALAVTLVAKLAAGARSGPEIPRRVPAYARPRFSCPVGRRTRVRMGVRTCLHDLQLVAVRYIVDSWPLQAVSAENGLFPRFRADF